MEEIANVVCIYEDVSHSLRTQRGALAPCLFTCWLQSQDVPYPQLALLLKNWNQWKGRENWGATNLIS